MAPGTAIPPQHTHNHHPNQHFNPFSPSWGIHDQTTSTRWPSWALISPLLLIDTAAEASNSSHNKASSRITMSFFSAEAELSYCCKFFWGGKKKLRVSYDKGGEKLDESISTSFNRFKSSSLKMDPGFLWYLQSYCSLALISRLILSENLYWQNSEGSHIFFPISDLYFSPWTPEEQPCMIKHPNKPL